MNQPLQQQLQAKREQLIQRIEAIQADFAQGRSEDSQERAIESENDDALNAIGHEAEQELRLVEHALQQLDQGRYGICESCGETISEQRLAALPYANLCIDCAQGETHAH